MDGSLEIKKRLRFITIENIFKMTINKKFPEHIISLLNTLLQYDDVINTILNNIQQPQNITILIEIFKVLYQNFIKKSNENSNFLNADFKAKILQSILNCIDVNTNNQSHESFSNLKIDNQKMELIFYSAQFASIMPSELPELLHPMPTNGYVLSFLLVTTSCSNGQIFDELFTFVEPFLATKLSLNPFSFGTICFMSSHKEFDDQLSLKNLIAFFKSLSDRPIIQILTPFVLRAVLLRLSSSTMKEIPTLISFLSSKMEPNVENSTIFSDFINKVIEMPESLSIIKPFCETLFKLYIRNVRSEVPFLQINQNQTDLSKNIKSKSKNLSENQVNIDINDNKKIEEEEPLKYVNRSVGASFCQLMYFCSINPFESFFVSRLEKQTDNVLLMMIYIVDHINKFSIKIPIESGDENVTSISFTTATFDPILMSLKSYLKKIDVNEITTRLYFHFCGMVIDYYESKKAINVLIQGLENNISLSSHILVTHCINFSFIFENIARSLKPGKSSKLLVSTLKVILSNHASTIRISHSNINVLSPSSSSDDISSNNESVNSHISDAFSRSASESTNFELPDFDRALTVIPESAIETAPTDATILFCSVLISLNKFNELFDLLPVSANAISPDFSKALMANFPNLKCHNFNTKVLSSLSSACHTLDMTEIYSLSQTFLMLLPGQSMQFLAITLQSLPRSIVLSSLLKTIPFVWSNPDETGKMIALVSYSHPDIAMEFIDTVLSNSTLRKRMFFIFKSSESNEQALIVIFKIIGYCSIHIDINYFVTTFLNYSVQTLNKYLTHQSRSPLVYLASLFAIRKLSMRVQSVQEERFEHVFPFKDFLVQYVCAYYLDIGILIIHSIETSDPEAAASSSILLSSPSSSSPNSSSKSGNPLDSNTILPEPSAHLSENNTIESLLKNVPKVLTTLTSMLPLRPIRQYDRHERSVELTTFMIQISDDSHFESIFKASKMFFCTLLECNPSISVFFRIAVPTFQALLKNRRWNRIIELLDILCNKYCSKLNIQQSSDVLSKTINNICLLIAYSIPLSLQTGYIEKVSNIIFSLVALQCSIRNQILSLPQSIRPVKPEIRGLSPLDANNAVVNFVEKYFTSSQTFELVITLLSFFLSKSPMMKIHHYGTALCIKKLILDRGSEDFRYDSQIVQSLIEASLYVDNEVVTIFIDIFEILLKMRLFSMLSTIMLSTEINDKIFTKIMERISNIEDGEKKLLCIIANFFDSNESSDEGERKRMYKFAFKAIPLICCSMKDLDNDTWVKLFIGVSNEVENIDNDLMKCLVSNEAYDGYFEFAKIIARDRILALQVILSSFPEEPTKLYIKMAIAFSYAEPETCEGFLSYAVTAMLKKNTGFSSFSMMQTLFESSEIDAHCWMDLSESLSALFIQNMRCRSVVVDCTIAFINKIDENELTEFWTNFAEICGANVEKWISIINRLITEGNVHFQSIAPILPELIMHLNDENFQKAIFTIAKKNGIKCSIANGNAFQSDQKVLFDLCESILKSKAFEDKMDVFLKAFVMALKENNYYNYTYICCNMIERLCIPIDDNNVCAIEALIEEIEFAKDINTKFIVDTIMRILN